MSDWLDELENKKKLEAEANQRKEVERRRQIEESIKKSSDYVGYKNNETAVNNIYTSICNYVDKANKVGDFKLRRYITASDHSFTIKAPDIGFPNNRRAIREITLRIEYDSFKVIFDHSFTVFKTINEVDDDYISYLVKWVATGEPKIKQGLFSRLFS